MKEILTTVKKVLAKVLAAMVTILLSIMTLLVLSQVFTRYVLSSPAAFTEELVRYSLTRSLPGSTCASCWCVTS